MKGRLLLDQTLQTPESVEDCLFAEERAKAFVLRHMKPANTVTEAAVEELRLELGLQSRKGTKRALCGFLQACAALSGATVKTLAFPSAKSVYVEGMLVNVEL
jgi:hypothetical protein